ncbi:E3 ubiquitin-protein ligase synoviolin [Nematocida sp. LUAm3]|nr:E3 ubiquitin-protein ligase synoviolin [Nematocida sp. LUAm3]KAI5176064.1 E3 ubiquitin-protein ligase synoviolin [Nematocida sp. LUAm2]KAI5177108.1 E3 ubiquitin-protein ligase synoviolin [Nematocida sp. LUAm1]
MYRHVGYLGGYLALFLGICIVQHRKDRTLYHMLTEVVDNRIEHFLFCSLLVYLLYLAGHVLIKCFIGPLLPLEVEGIQDNSMKYLGNICLVITLFADNIGMKGLLMFSLVFGMKILHWAIGLRIETIEKGGVDRKGIRKMYMISFLLFWLDMLLMIKTLQLAFSRPGINILFCFEFSMLFAYSIRCLYALGVAHLCNERSIEDRILFMFYGDLSFGVFKIAAHILCFVWTTINFRMPINLLRETIMIIKSLGTRIKSVMAYVELLKEIEKYPDVIHSEMTSEGICLICHEEMEIGKKLECTHIFHLACLKEWLHRQQSCPICRTEVKLKKPSILSTDILSEQASQTIPNYLREESDEFEGVPVTVEND